MDYIKIFLPRMLKELESLIQTIWIFSHDIGMEFETEKWTISIRPLGEKEN